MSEGHKTMYFQVPSNMHPTSDGHMPKVGEKDRHGGAIPTDFIEVQTAQKGKGYNDNASIRIGVIRNDGSMEGVQTEVTKGGYSYGSYISNNDQYFHYLSCIINGNARKITQKQFKAERVRRI